MAAAHPKAFAAHHKAGAYLHNLAQTLGRRGDLAGARALVDRAIVHQRAALELQARDPVALRYLRNHYGYRAEVLTALGDRAGAAEAAKERDGVEVPEADGPNR